jgi:Tol biopolymer transport system component
LYFLGKDNDWVTQLFRMERDGRARTQLTFEPFNVTDYDVSLEDGSVAYVTGNQLVWIHADGSDRRMLVDGGSGPDLRGFYRPVFSPDGKTLAYSYAGLYFYDIASRTATLMIEDQLEEPQLLNGVEQRLPIETYGPKRFSPDGKRLLITLGYFEGTSAAIFDPGTKDLVRITDKDGNPISYYGLIDWSAWSADGSSVYAAVPIPQFIYRAGELWWAEATTGVVTTRLPFDTESGTMRFPYEPYLAPDGNLYYFYGEYGADSGFLETPLLELVRSAADGVTDRTVLREENFRLMQDALWAPDASFVIVNTLPERMWDQPEGVLELYYTDGEKGSIWLAPYAHQMKWGP